MGKKRKPKRPTTTKIYKFIDKIPAQKNTDSKIEKKVIKASGKNLSIKSPWPNRYFASKSAFFFTLILLCFSFVGGMSVTGLLLFSENIGTSGILVLPSPSPSSSLPPEPSIEVDVYSDKGCNQALSHINWGEIVVGGSVYRTVYIKNSGDTATVLNFVTKNFSPVEIEEHMYLYWDYDGSSLEAGQVKKILLTLTVDNQITDLGGFNFDIIFVCVPK
jgi:hypothetical protein